MLMEIRPVCMLFTVIISPISMLSSKTALLLTIQDLVLGSMILSNSHYQNFKIMNPSSLSILTFN